MEPDDIRLSLKRLGITHEVIAEAMGVKDRTIATKLMAGTRRMKVEERQPLLDLVARSQRDAGENGGDSDPVGSYVQIEVLPTYAGMGGGGTGDGDLRLAMLPRRLVEEELRAKPSDLLMIDVRGNSMEPLFHNGDQLVIDKRDVNPVQPGPFALWDGDGYVVKNVERVRGRYRVFSTNSIYSPQEFDPDEVTIMGRPVWFARRL